MIQLIYFFIKTLNFSLVFRIYKLDGIFFFEKPYAPDNPNEINIKT